MRFMFDDRKAAQAAAHLVRLSGGRLNYMVLIKLLYLSDRRSLLETGAPITGDRMVAMPHGPVLSRIYDLINMGCPERASSSPWYEHLTEPSGYDIQTTAVSATEELSAYELAVLAEVHAKFGGLNKWALRDYTHTLPEWSDPEGSTYPIDPVGILRSAGRPESEIESLVADAEEIWFMRSLEKARV